MTPGLTAEVCGIVDIIALITASTLCDCATGWAGEVWLVLDHLKWLGVTDTRPGRGSDHPGGGAAITYTHCVTSQPAPQSQSKYLPLLLLNNQELTLPVPTQCLLLAFFVQIVLSVVVVTADGILNGIYGRQTQT